MNVNTISVSDLLKAQAQGERIDLIDVRTPAEFRTAHASGARSAPLDRLDPRAIVQARTGGSTEPLYIICQSGNRSRRACEKFAAEGFSNAVTVEGGTVAWERAGGPITRGKQVISLERQVRIAAGLLVLLGAVLALTIHPYFVLLSAFIGAGLVFSGVTDTCGMGMVLARMPWNNVMAGDATSGANAADAAPCRTADREGNSA